MSEPLRVPARSRLIATLLGAATLLAGVGFTVPQVAQAQSNVVVLGIRSVEGDDEFTRNLTGALRHAASQVDGWTISDREVTLAQMALAHGCNDPDAACMANIATALEADLIIYGDVRRTSAGQEFDFSLNLHIFNQEGQSIEQSVSETIPGIRRDIDDLREPSRRYVAALSGAARTGTISVTSNVPGAEVFVDGEPAGATDGAGHLLVTDISEGNRSVEVRADGYDTMRETVMVQAYGEATVDAELAGGGDGGGGGGGGGVSPLLVTGAVITGLGAVAAGFWIGGFVHVQTGIGGSDWDMARQAYDGMVTNFCDEDPPLHTPDRCDEYFTWMPIQIASGVVAAVLGGVGIGLIVAGASEGDDEATARIQVTPAFSREYAGLNVLGSF